MNDPTSNNALERYGLEWTGVKTAPVAVKMADGYWTPWHLAQQRIAELEMERDAGDMNSQAYWRGQDAGVAGVSGRWREALEEAIPKPGTLGDKQLEALYRSTVKLRLRITELETESFEHVRKIKAITASNALIDEGWRARDGRIAELEATIASLNGRVDGYKQALSEEEHMKNKREIDWGKPPHEGCVFIDICEGVEGPSVSIGDNNGGYRVAGPKPWGGGQTSRRFTASIEDLKEAIRMYDRQAQLTELGEA